MSDAPDAPAAPESVPRATSAIPGENPGIYVPPGMRAVAGRNGGTIVVATAESNAMFRRGRDRFPRRQAMRALVLRALTESQERVVAIVGQRRRSRQAVEGAMILDVVARLQKIARTGSNRDVLRMVADMHAILQPDKDESSGGVAPVPARFVYAPDAGAGEAGEEPSGPSAGVVLGPDGKAYVEATE